MTDCEESREDRPQGPLLQTSKQKDTIHQNVSHHVPVAPKKDQLNFLEMKVQKLQASVSIQRYRKDVTRRQANLRSQTWYPKIGKNRSRKGWAEAAEKPSIRMQKS